MVIEKVSCFPHEGSPEVIPGSPADGDLVRITSAAGVAYQHYTAPSDPPPPQPRDLTFGQFQDLCYNAEDGGALGRVAAPEGTLEEQEMAGMWRYGEIELAVEAAASTPLGRSVFTRYQGGMSSGFVYNKAVSLLVVLVGMEILSADELDAVIAAWPVGNG
ncbi:MAG: hypothetical protein AB7I36_08215 [Rhodospirillaceae bacterium]